MKKHQPQRPNNLLKLFFVLTYALCSSFFSFGQNSKDRTETKSFLGQFFIPKKYQTGPMDVHSSHEYYFSRDYLGTKQYLRLNIKSKFTYGQTYGEYRYMYKGIIYTRNGMAQYDHQADIGFPEVKVTGMHIKFVVLGISGPEALQEFTYNSNFNSYKICEITKETDLTKFSFAFHETEELYFENGWNIQDRILKFNKLMSNQKQYTELIGKADNAFKNKNWAEAKIAYTEASKIMFNERYPKDQLEIIKEKELEQTKKKELEAEKAKVPVPASNTGAAGAKAGSGNNVKDGTNKSNNESASDKSKTSESSTKSEKVEKESLGKNGLGLSKKDQAEIDAAKKAADDKIEADRKAEEARLEAERIAREEKARLERKDNWEKQKQSETDANFDMLEDLSVAALLLHISIAQLTYSDLEMSGPGNIYPDPSMTFDMEFGYGLTYAPLYTDVREEKFDGNVTTYDESAEASNIFNLDYQFKASFWPVQSRNFGLAFSGGVSGGHGFTFESFNYQLQYGTKAYLGSETFKIYTEYNLVNRTIIESSWIDSKVTREGKSSGTSHQLKAGLRLNFDLDWQSETRAAIDILPVFELDQRSTFLNGYGRLPQSWSNGIEVGLNIDNRLHAYFRSMWNFPIFGENQYALGASADKTDIFFNFGFVRNLNFIFNNEVMGSVSDVQSLRRMAKEQRPHTLYFLMPSYQYFKTQEGQFNYQPAISITPIGYGYDYFPIENFSIGLSGLFTYQILKMAIMPKSKNIPSGMKEQEAYKMENLNIEIPLSIKYHNSFQTNNNFWLMAAYNNVFAVSQVVKAFALADNKELNNNKVDLNTTLNSIQYGVGCDFNIGDSYFTAGLIYEKGRKNLIEGADGSKVNGVRFLVGAKL